MLRKGMFLADRYEILDQVGTGGMSDVYKAKCHKLNRFVAIKVLKQEFSQDKNFVSKFRIEAQSAAGLTHPNVVNVYDVGDENGIHYIVMELVEGITLKRYIEKKGKLSSKEAVSIAIQVAQGIEAAHSHHIIHRDIKPQNIIISKEGKVKVTDFGIARASSSNTINSTAMGSVHYISPEQARGGYSDERSDIYSFGITLYEMLTGTVPFDGDTTVAIAVQHIQDEIAPASQVVEDIPISVDKIVVKCTQKKTERRYQNATELIADLKKSLVMPDVDFVKMVPVFGDTINAGVESAGVKTDLINADVKDDDIELIDDGLDDDDEDPDAILAEEDEFEDEKKSNVSKNDDDDDDDIEDGSNEKLDKIMKWIGVGIVALIIIFTIFAVIKLGGVFGNKGGNETTTVESTVEESSSVNNSELITVPDVKGKTADEAKSILNAAGLGYSKANQTSDTVKEGLVIKQSLEPGTKTSKNTTIIVSISTGNNSFTVPNVTKMTVEEATSLLQDNGLVVNPIYDWSDTVAQGVVISQTPNSGNVKSGDSVTIHVSRGKEVKNVTMIDVRGMTESDARAALDNLGLKVTVSSNNTYYSSEYAKGKVALQDTTVGKSIPQGTTIELTLSAGTNPTTQAPPVSTQVAVPDLSKKTQEEAQIALSNVGLQMSTTTQSSATIAKGSVISQATAAGTKVEKGTTINVVISSGQ